MTDYRSFLLGIQSQVSTLPGARALDALEGSLGGAIGRAAQAGVSMRREEIMQNFDTVVAKQRPASEKEYADLYKTYSTSLAFGERALLPSYKKRMGDTYIAKKEAGEEKIVATRWLKQVEKSYLDSGSTDEAQLEMYLNRVPEEVREFGTFREGERLLRKQKGVMEWEAEREYSTLDRADWKARHKQYRALNELNPPLNEEIYLDNFNTAFGDMPERLKNLPAHQELLAEHSRMSSVITEQVRQALGKSMQSAISKDYTEAMALRVKELKPQSMEQAKRFIQEELENLPPGVEVDRKALTDYSTWSAERVPLLKLERKDKIEGKVSPPKTVDEIEPYANYLEQKLTESLESEPLEKPTKDNVEKRLLSILQKDLNVSTPFKSLRSFQKYADKDVSAFSFINTGMRLRLIQMVSNVYRKGVSKERERVDVIYEETAQAILSGDEESIEQAMETFNAFTDALTQLTKGTAAFSLRAIPGDEPRTYGVRIPVDILNNLLVQPPSGYATEEGMNLQIDITTAKKRLKDLVNERMEVLKKQRPVIEKLTEDINILESFNSLVESNMNHLSLSPGGMHEVDRAIINVRRQADRYLGENEVEEALVDQAKVAASRSIAGRGWQNIDDSDELRKYLYKYQDLLTDDVQGEIVKKYYTLLDQESTGVSSKQLRDAEEMLTLAKSGLPVKYIPDPVVREAVVLANTEGLWTSAPENKEELIRKAPQNKVWRKMVNDHVKSFGEGSGFDPLAYLASVGVPSDMAAMDFSAPLVPQFVKRMRDIDQASELFGQTQAFSILSSGERAAFRDLMAQQPQPQIDTILTYALEELKNSKNLTGKHLTDEFLPHDVAAMSANSERFNKSFFANRAPKANITNTHEALTRQTLTHWLGGESYAINADNYDKFNTALTQGWMGVSGLKTIPDPAKLNKTSTEIRHVQKALEEQFAAVRLGSERLLTYKEYKVTSVRAYEEALKQRVFYKDGSGQRVEVLDRAPSNFSVRYYERFRGVPSMVNFEVLYREPLFGMLVVLEDEAGAPIVVDAAG